MDVINTDTVDSWLPSKYLVPLCIHSIVIKWADGTNCIETEPMEDQVGITTVGWSCDAVISILEALFEELFCLIGAARRLRERCETEREAPIWYPCL